MMIRDGTLSRGRQPAIDIFKFTAAILVIAIHTNPLEQISETANFILTQCFGRMAVPFFIICTGFFTAQKIGFEFSGDYNLKEARIVILKSSWKIFTLYLIWSVIYLVLLIPEWIADGWFSLKAFIDWGISFFLTGSYFHLWCLIEVCYALLILALIVSILKKPVVYVMAVLLWSIEAVCCGYGELLPEGFQSFISFTGKIKMLFESIVRVLPMILVGFIIFKIPRKRVFYGIGLLVTAVAFGIEIYFIRYINGGKLFMTLPLAYCLFGFIHSFDHVIKAKNTEAFAKISTFVYLVHPAFIWLLYLVTDLPNVLMFTVVTFLSVLSGYLYYRTGLLIRKSKTVKI